MNETYNINEVRGTETSIEWVSVTINYEEDGFRSGHGFELLLEASLPTTATDEEIIKEGLSALGNDTYLLGKKNAQDHIDYQRKKSLNPIVYRSSEFNNEIGNNDELTSAIMKVIRTANRVKDEHLEGGVEVTISDGTFVYDSTRSSIDLLNGARVDASARPEAWDENPKRWRMKDGSWVTLTRDDLEIISAAIADHVQTCFEWFEQQETAAKQCTTVAEARTLRETVEQGIPDA